MKILNPNTSGQGYCEEHKNHFLHNMVINNNYKYSHSVYVGLVTPYGNERVIYHCYKLNNHCVSFPDHENFIPKISNYNWQTQVSTASNYKTHGFGAAQLNKHLKNKARRYKLTVV